MLRALTAIGVLHESEERLYSLTPLGVTLRSNVPGSMRAWVLLAFGDDQGTAWQALSHAVRTGELAFRHIFGTDIWTRLAERPEAARLFTATELRFMPEAAVSIRNNTLGACTDRSSRVVSISPLKRGYP